MSSLDTATSTYEIVTITPAMAAAMLARNNGNRSVRRNRVSGYARDMAAGRWHPDTAEAIKFSPEGELLDGQHRLLACVDAKAPFTTLVAYGVPADAHYALDTGIPRKLNDLMGYRHEVNGNNLAAAISMAYRLELRNRDGTAKAPTSYLRPTHAEAEAWLARNPGIRDSVKQAMKQFRNGRVRVTGLAAVHHLACRSWGREMPDLFIDDLAQPLGQPIPQPAALLRNAFFSSAFSGRKLTEIMATALTIKAMNHHLLGVTVKVLKWVDRESFPKIVEPE